MTKDDAGDPSDLPTKRHSGTLQRGPVFESMARQLATEMEDRARAGDHSAKALAAEALVLAGTFASWALGDPGPASREQTIKRWHDVDLHARALRGEPT